MKRTSWGLSLILLAFSPLLVFAEIKDDNETAFDYVFINKQEFNGFNRCKFSKELMATTDRLIATGRPFRKDESGWFYAVKTEVMGLPVKAIVVGVCDMSGERACGWGSYLAVIIAKPFKDARKWLKNKTGIDYTEEKRDRETGVTLRPFLAPNKSGDESALICDPGLL